MLFKGPWLTSWLGSASFLTSPGSPTLPSGISLCWLDSFLLLRGVKLWPCGLLYFPDTSQIQPRGLVPEATLSSYNSILGTGKAEFSIKVNILWGTPSSQPVSADQPRAQTFPSPPWPVSPHAPSLPAGAGENFLCVHSRTGMPKWENIPSDRISSSAGEWKSPVWACIEMHICIC